MKKIILFLAGTLMALLIAGVNLFLIYPWFLGNGPLNLGSIEVSYVSMGRFIVDYFPHLSYAPYWYFGFPFNVFYTPLLPVLEAVLNYFANIGLWQAYRIISGAGFVLAPVSLFLLAWVLTKRIVPAVLAGLFYSLLPSLFYFILPSGEVASDTISRLDGFFDPRRLVILSRWGEGPHTFSLAFLPLGGLFFFRFLEKQRKLDLFLTAVFTGLTALTNAVGFYALVFLLLSVFVAHWSKNPSELGKTVRLSLLALISTYGLIAFWYNRAFLGTFFGEGGGVFQNYLNLLPWGLVGIGLGLAGLFFFFQKVVRDKGLIVALFWFLILFFIVYIYYTSAPSEFSEQRVELAPQALRLMTEVDMAFSLLLAALFGVLISFIQKKIRFGQVLGNLIGVLVVLGMLSYAYSYAPFAQIAVDGQVDLVKTGEYEIAGWLKEHTDVSKGERVYVAGNYGFYLNWFTNVWQLRGGLYQAKTHFWPEHIFYQVNKGTDPQIALSWLKVSNIKYLVVNTSASRELYKDFSAPEKFADLSEVYQDKGDIIYEVPLNPPAGGPAKIVNLSFLERFKPPKKADDQKKLAEYADWLDRAKPASFQVVNNDVYKINGQVGPNEGILVQMTYDKGFRAKSGQAGFKVRRDPMGFMILTPERPVEAEVVLVHGKTWDAWLGYLITLSTSIMFLILPFLKLKIFLKAEK